MSKAAAVTATAVTTLILVGCAADFAQGPNVGNAMGAGRTGRPNQSVRSPLERSGSRAARPGLPALNERARLGDYLTYAALTSPALKAAFERWQAALEKVPQERSLPDPRLTYGYFVQGVETRAGPQQQKLALAQTFPWRGKLDLGTKAASQAAEAARERYESERLALFHAVRDAYYELYYLSRALAIFQENRELLKYIEQVVRTRYATAAAGHSELIRVQIELAKLEDRVQTLTELRGPIVARLNAALNRPAAAEVPWPGSIPEERIQATDEEILAWAASANPALKALGHEVDARRYGVLLARKGYYPDLTLGLEYIQTGHAGMPGSVDSGKDPVIATISVNLPVWQGKYQAAEREAAAQLRVAQSVKLQRQNALNAEIKRVLYELGDAERKIDLYAATLLPKARESMKATEAAFRAGTATFLDLMDAERVLLEFELSRERALANYAQRLAELEMLVGRELPRIAKGAAKAPADE